MKEYSSALILAVVLIAFIAGYSIVSFIVKKLKESNTATSKQSAKGSEPEADRPPCRESGTHINEERVRQEEEFRKRQQDEAKRSEERSERLTEEQQHARVLGLSGRVTPADVKKAYREVMLKYHPDRVDHLGDEFKKIAEEKTKEINAAYAYFRRKYNIP